MPALIDPTDLLQAQGDYRSNEARHAIAGGTAVSEIWFKVPFLWHVMRLAGRKICLHLSFFVVCYSRRHKELPLPAFRLHTPSSIIDRFTVCRVILASQLSHKLQFVYDLDDYPGEICVLIAARIHSLSTHPPPHQSVQLHSPI